MNQISTEYLIKAHLKTLPESVKLAINSFDWNKEVFDVGRKYSLHLDNIGEIETEVILVILGLISPKDFYDQMVHRIGLKEEVALDVASEINEKVFLRIRDFMKNYYSQKEESDLGIKTQEKRVLQNAGIRIGEDSEELETSKNPDDEEEVEVKIPPLDYTPTKEKVLVNSAPAIPDIRSKLENPQVFKGKSTAYLDPYREPIE
jgi:glutaredoxin-related protein